VHAVTDLSGVDLLADDLGFLVSTRDFGGTGQTRFTLWKSGMEHRNDVSARSEAITTASEV
jgi:hypothetical protein